LFEQDAAETCACGGSEAGVYCGVEATHMVPTCTVVLRKEPEGGFTVLVPALPEIVSYGETLEEAQRMAADAIRCAIFGRQDEGEPIPVEGPIVTLPAEERTADLIICRVASAAP
jgi:predicted RNase H-like HicB family nuclease